MDIPTPPVARMRSADWLFWLSWVAASTAAILGGFGILYACVFLASAVLPGINEDRLGGILMFPVLGTLLGVLQWLVLRRRIPRSGWWVLATLAGMLGGIALGSAYVKALAHFSGREWNWDSFAGAFVVYGVIGFLLALAQIPILRRHIKYVALWPLASVLGWFALSLVVGKSIDRTSDILAFGAVPAAFTGACLAWLLRSRGSLPTRSA